MFNPIKAQAAVQTNLQSLIIQTGSLIDSAIMLLMLASFLVLLWGLAKFIFNSGDEKKIEDGKRLMFWGVIALFVLASLAGIVSFLKFTFGV